MEIVQPPTSLVFSLESGSAGSSSHPCGRPSTSQAATFNSLGGTVTWGAGNRHRFLIPPSLLFPSGPTQLPVTEKSSVATRSRPACSVAFPTPRLESSGGGLGEPLAHGLFIVFPSPRTSAPFTPHDLPKLGDSKSSKALALHPVATGTKKSLPGSRPWQPRGWRWESFRVGGRGAAVLQLLAGVSRRLSGAGGGWLSDWGGDRRASG